MKIIGISTQEERYKPFELTSIVVTEVCTIGHTYFGYALWVLTGLVKRRTGYQDPAGVRVTQSGEWIVCVS